MLFFRIEKSLTISLSDSLFKIKLSETLSIKKSLLIKIVSCETSVSNIAIFLQISDVKVFFNFDVGKDDILTNSNKCLVFKIVPFFTESSKLSKKLKMILLLISEEFMRYISSNNDVS